MTIQMARISAPPSLEAQIEPEAQMEQALREFDAWAANADQSQSGWQSDWQGWLRLMAQAEEAMLQDALSPRALALVGRCWAISDEVEWCADWARDHLQDAPVRGHVLALTQDAHADTRWQACNVLGDLPAEDAEARAALNASLDDADPYVRRRAFLALLRHPDAEAPAVTARMLIDPDAYNRFVAVKEGGSFPALHEQVERASQDPEVFPHLAYYSDHKEMIDRYDK